MKFTVSEHLDNVEDTFVAFSAMHGRERGAVLSCIVSLAATAILAADHMKLVAALAQQGELPDSITGSVDKVHDGMVNSISCSLDGAIQMLSLMGLGTEYTGEQSVAFRIAALKQTKLALSRIGDTVKNGIPSQD